MNNISGFIFELLGYGFLISFIIFIGMGYANKIVIFNDKADFIRTISLTGSGALLILTTNLDAPSLVISYVITPLLGVTTLILFSDSVIISVRNNGNFYLGLVIAIYRMIYISFTIAIVACLALPSKNKNGSINVSRTLFGLALAGGVAYSSFLLINGSKVKYLNRVNAKQNYYIDNQNS